jgi:hypothetical protein
MLYLFVIKDMGSEPFEHDSLHYCEEFFGVVNQKVYGKVFPCSPISFAILCTLQIPYKLIRSSFQVQSVKSVSVTTSLSPKKCIEVYKYILPELKSVGM